MNTARLTMANDSPTRQVMLTLREEVADEYALLLRTLEQLGCRHSLDSLTEGRYPITVSVAHHVSTALSCGVGVRWKTVTLDPLTRAQSCGRQHYSRTRQWRASCAQALHRACALAWISCISMQERVRAGTQRKWSTNSAKRRWSLCGCCLPTL